MWVGVRQRFERFNRDLIVTTDQYQDGMTKQLNARKVLQRAYYGYQTDNPPGFIVGSWGKQTQRRPPVDVDLFFEMPPSEFARFDGLAGNGQSALLQEVKRVLLGEWPQTDMRGDGQVVQVQFNSLTLEIVPAFRIERGQFVIPDTKNGGRWRTVDPVAEMGRIENVDQGSATNARQLMRMMKCWRDECNVPLESFIIEQVVAHFMADYVHKGWGYFWYDWFARDFLIFLIKYSGGYLHMPGTYDVVMLGNEWLSRAETARERALKACHYEYVDATVEAGEEWQKIFGPKIPIHVL